MGTASTTLVSGAAPEVWNTARVPSEKPVAAAAADHPLLSVVVPVYNVRDYLLACLESIARQTQPGLEVILVDDGSTDESGQMAEEFAAGRPSWSVVHVENGGLGRARNIGMDRAGADFIAFADSDDVVPRDAYELMLHAVRGSGSDLVSGGVLRFDGARTHSSGLHLRAVPTTRIRTHIRDTPSLIYDTTAWNKVFRRAFLVEQGLRFPEGVYYEDIPLTLRAHYLAASVDVIAEPVYLWRRRQTAEQSITQRRSETQNLVDRMAAVRSIDDFLVQTGEKRGKKVHDTKVLTLDMPLFIDVLHEGSVGFQDRVVELCADYLPGVDPGLVAKLTPLRQLQYHLILHGLRGHLVDLQDQIRQPGALINVVREGLHLYADLPYRGDPVVGAPDSLYEVTRSQPLVTGIRDVRWENGGLVVDGHAYIHRVSDAGPLSAVHRLQLRRIGMDEDLRARVPSTRVRRLDLTAKTRTHGVSYTGAGFLARIPSEPLHPPNGCDAVEFELLAQVAAPSARRGSAVSGPLPSRARHPARAFLGEDLLVVPGYRGRRFRIGVRRVAAVLVGADIDDHAVSIRLRSVAGFDLSGAALHLRRLDSVSGVTVPLEPVDGEEVRAVVAVDDLEIHESSLNERDWRIWLVCPLRPGDPAVSAATAEELVSDASAYEGDDADRQYPAGARVAPLHLSPELPEAIGLARGRRVIIGQAGLRGALLSDTRTGPVLTDFAVDDDGMHLSGLTAGSAATALVLAAASDRLTVPMVVRDGRWAASVPADGPPGRAVLRWLQSGRWSVLVTTDEPNQPDVPVRASSRAEQELRPAEERATVSAALTSDADHEVSLVVDNGGVWSDRGKLNRERARKVHYRVARRMPLEDTVLFEAWKGRQYSDNPRAVYEELVRRGDPRRMVWAVEHHGVETPPGAETVITGGRDYFRHLGRARWVVSNDAMPTHFIKRDGARYGQTWHGTPLKRIGFDIENLQMSNRNYLVQFAREVTKWDALVSPNPFSSQIFARAFHYAGPVLEIGYPRNDVFFREADRELRTTAVRERLALPAGKKVILYAPTWRDNQYDNSGRYQFSMKLDLERLYREMGEEAVLLIRGHQLVAERVDTSLFGGFARNVSTYPDISDLYLVADVLITDYSSVMFDYVNTGRPMIFYTYDLETYRDDLRGFYFDFEAEAPGPLLGHTEEVIDALRSLDEVSSESAGRYAAFRARFAGLEDGYASARFIDQFLMA